MLAAPAALVQRGAGRRWRWRKINEQVMKRGPLKRRCFCFCLIMKFLS